MFFLLPFYYSVQLPFVLDFHRNRRPGCRVGVVGVSWGVGVADLMAKIKIRHNKKKTSRRNTSCREVEEIDPSLKSRCFSQ